MRRYLIAGNWKMNGYSHANSALIADIVAAGDQVAGVEVLVCPPFPYLLPVADEIGSAAVALGAQNVSEHAPGAFTGEVAAAMLSDLGVTYVIVGHSERRALYGETDAIVAAKFSATVAAGLKPVLCVGESLAEREAGETGAVVERQIAAVLERCGRDGIANAVIAYEPVWAIGTGRTATPEMAEDVHAAIRHQIAACDAELADQMRILYGGSMKAANASGLLSMPNIDGGLIGGAALKADEFIAIAVAAAASN